MRCTAYVDTQRVHSCTVCVWFAFRFEIGFHSVAQASLKLVTICLTHPRSWLTDVGHNTQMQPFLFLIFLKIRLIYFYFVCGACVPVCTLVGVARACLRAHLQKLQ